MATRRFSAGIAGRLPGKTRSGSQASFKKSTMQSARRDMADIIRKYEDLIKSFESMTPTFLFNAMKPVYNRSQVYVPRKTGKLADSADMRFMLSDEGKPMVALTYGGPDVPYAPIVHEFVWLNHEPPTRAKYLQSALEEELDAFLVSLAVDYATLL